MFFFTTWLVSSENRSLTTSFLITVVTTVIELVTHPDLGDTATTGAGELTATAALVH